jgi:tetratricopeptide (TPR) repeat protein
MSTTRTQTWEHLDAKEVQLFRERLDRWKLAVEEKTGVNFIRPVRKAAWQRARNPPQNIRKRTWDKHVRNLLKYLSADWSASLTAGEPAIEISHAQFLKGPEPQLVADADLQEFPRLTPMSSRHLYGFIADMRTQVEQAQVSKNITQERKLRDTIATTLETLQSWEHAARELEFLVQIEERLKEYVYMVRVLLRKGIALYNAKQFENAKATIERAIVVLEKKIPSNAELRSEIRLWDYLGLCYIKLKQSAKALEVFLNKTHQARARQLPSPLGDASRLIRIGIAYLEQGDFRQAKGSFLEGIKVRLEMRALPETARALRYLGLLYFRDKKYIQSLCIWNLCLKVQRGFYNEVEEIKLQFFRARLFARLWELFKSESGFPYPVPVTCEISKELFSDDLEWALLNRTALGFRDVETIYKPEDFLRMAQSGYRYAADKAREKNVPYWANEAECALNRLTSISRA